MFVHIFSPSLSLCVSSTFNHIHICSGSSLALISSRGFIDIRSLTHTHRPLSLSLSSVKWRLLVLQKRFRIDNELFSWSSQPKMYYSVSYSTAEIVCACLCFAFFTLGTVFLFMFLDEKRLCAHEPDPFVHTFFRFKFQR
jgi:hypothetical protein